MRKISQIAAAAASLLIGWGAAVHAQPLIIGNTSSFGCGPIYTNDYTLGTIVASFIPTGAGPTPCPNPPSNNNGRAVAVGGTEIFYTELVDNPTSPPGFGPTDLIRVADFNNGSGSADTRSLANPRPGAGIQDLTFQNGVLYALTGYETDPPWVYGLHLSTGAILSGPIVLAGSTSPIIPLPAGTDSDGFAILPNGHFLINNGDTSCIFNEYDNRHRAPRPKRHDQRTGRARQLHRRGHGRDITLLSDRLQQHHTDQLHGGHDRVQLLRQRQRPPDRGHLPCTSGHGHYRCRRRPPVAWPSKQRRRRKILRPQS